MLSPRFNHTATLLPTGKVLVAGGFNSNALASAELFDPATGTWTATSPMTTNRSSHTATLLPNGKVLIAGGGGEGTYNSAELYDPITATWTTTGSMNVARLSHTATLLRSGKVLIAGGFSPITDALSHAEIYDPAAGAWTIASSLITPRVSQTATLLTDGTVLVAGGTSTTNDTSAAEVFDANLGFSAAWQPQISALTSPVDPDANFVITGTQFRGVSEGSSGTSQDSPSDYPLVQLRSLENAQTLFLRPTAWSSNSFTSLPVNGLWPGWTMATVFVNGIPSQGNLFDLQPLLPGPLLTSVVSSGNITLTWPTGNPPRFHLQATTDFSGTNWVDVNGLVTVTNALGHVTIPVGQGVGFYRLKF